MMKKFFSWLEKYLDEKQLQAINDIHQTKEMYEQATRDLYQTKANLIISERKIQDLLKEIKESKAFHASLSQRIDSVELKFEKNELEREAFNHSHELYISMLTGYTAHDLKNNIQNIYSVLSYKKSSDITDDDLLIFRNNIKMIEESINKFSTLSLVSKTSEINAKYVISNILSINEHSLKKYNITCTSMLEKDLKFDAPFFTMTTILNNIFINAINALLDSSQTEKNIYIDYGPNDIKQTIWFKIYDNAPEIPIDIQEKIFTYGFTTRTNQGDGMGLSHVRDVCSHYNGSVELIKSDIIGYTKAFYIELPIKQD